MLDNFFKSSEFKIDVIQSVSMLECQKSFFDLDGFSLVKTIIFRS